MINKIKNKMISEGILRPRTQKGRKCIIMYHGIDLKENLSFNPRFFSSKNFEQHLKYYKKHYNIVTLSDFFKDKNLNTDKVNIAITFDDGYLNNLKYALPLLEKYAIHATFFVTGLNNNNYDILWADLVDICSFYIKNEELIFDNKKFKKDSSGKFPDLINYIKSKKIVGTPSFNMLKKKLINLSEVNLYNKELLDYWMLLGPEDIREIGRSNYVRVGSHGYYHNNLGNIEIDQAVKEITMSKEYLESLTQYEINSIGYPDGSYTPELSKEAFKLGFKYQCAVNYKFKEDINKSYLYNRLGLYPTSNINLINYQIQKFSYEHSDIYKHK